jgi:hypothetical protein
VVISNAALGQCVFTLSAADTAAVQAGSYDADVKVIFADLTDDFPSIGTVALQDHASR